jgi:superfamily II DNA or RNA helicase
MIKGSKLSTIGYILPRVNLSEKQLKKIKKDLHVKPKSGFLDDENMKYKVYVKTKKYIIIPRYYGIINFGDPEKNKFKPKKSKIKFIGTLRDYQHDIVNKCIEHIKMYGGGMLCVPPGEGKCLGKGTKVMMYDGLIKNVEDINVDDLIMGDNFSKRTVLSICSGTEQLYKVLDEETNEYYIVNESHILSLKDKNNIVYDMNILNYLKLDDENKDKYFGYRCPVLFKTNKLSDELSKESYRYAVLNLKLVIPTKYKCGSYKTRLLYLVGLTDRFGYINKNNIELIFNDILENDFKYLCRSLGFKYTNKTVKIRGTDVKFHIVSGNINEILMYSNEYEIKKDLKYTNSLNYKIKIEKLEIGEYYGFEIDGNHRFMLGDFTITHNTTMALRTSAEFGYDTLIISHKTCLVNQWVDRIKQFTGEDAGIIRQNTVDVKNKKFVVAMIQSLGKRNYDPDIFKKFGMVIVDECFVGTEIIQTKNGDMTGDMTIEDLYNLYTNDYKCEKCDSFCDNQFIDKNLYNVSMVFGMCRNCYNSIYISVPLIKSYNIKTLEYEYKQMLNVSKKQTKELIQIFFENDVVKCTPTHLFLTDEGYVEANKLTINSKIIGTNTQILYISYLYYNKYINVYDIEVQDNNNFVLSKNNSEIVVHNCHHFSSKHFSRALFKVGAKYTMGLSATPYRNDGLIKITNWFLGDIMYQKKTKTNNQVVVKSLFFYSTVPTFKELKMRVKSDVRPNFVKMVSNIVEMEYRNNHIINIINTIRLDPERKILVLSDRKDHLNILKIGVDKYINLDIKNGDILQDECSTYLYTGSLKDHERIEAEQNADILFATTGLANEGLDIERLNTIILVTPKKDVKQSVGRIMRKILNDGDIRPLIIDIIDDFSIFPNQYKKRLEFYKESKYVIQTNYLFDNQIVSEDNYDNLICKKKIEKSNITYEDILFVDPVLNDTVEQPNDHDGDCDKHNEKKCYETTNIFI